MPGLTEQSPPEGLPGKVSKEVSWATMRVDLPAVFRSAPVVYSSSALRLAVLGSKRSHGEREASMFSFFLSLEDHGHFILDRLRPTALLADGSYEAAPAAAADGVQLRPVDVRRARGCVLSGFHASAGDGHGWVALGALWGPHESHGGLWDSVDRNTPRAQPTTP